MENRQKPPVRTRLVEAVASHLHEGRRAQGFHKWRARSLAREVANAHGDDALRFILRIPQTRDARQVLAESAAGRYDPQLYHAVQLATSHVLSVKPSALFGKSSAKHAVNEVARKMGGEGLGLITREDDPVRALRVAHALAGHTHAFAQGMEMLYPGVEHRDSALELVETHSRKAARALQMHGQLVLEALEHHPTVVQAKALDLVEHLNRDAKPRGFFGLLETVGGGNDDHETEMPLGHLRAELLLNELKNRGGSDSKGTRRWLKEKEKETDEALETESELE